MVSVLGGQPGGGLAKPTPEGRVAIGGHRGRWRHAFVLRLRDGRLMIAVSVRARDVAVARVRAERALSRVWPVPLEDAVTTVKQLHRRRRGWSVEWSTQDPGGRGGDGGGAGARVPLRPRDPVGPVSVARRDGDDRS